MAKRMVRWEDAVGCRPEVTKSTLYRALWQVHTLPYVLIDQRAYVDLDDVERLWDSRQPVVVRHEAKQGPLAPRKPRRKAAEAAA